MINNKNSIQFPKKYPKKVLDVDFVPNCISQHTKTKILSEKWKWKASDNREMLRIILPYYFDLLNLL